MKVISKRLLNRKSAAYVENIHAERNILVRVRHPFVVMMHAVRSSNAKRLCGYSDSSSILLLFLVLLVWFDDM